MADTAAAGKELRNAAAAWLAEEPNKLPTAAGRGNVGNVVFDPRGRARREEEAATLEVMAAADQAGVNGEAATLGKAAAEANGNGAATLGKVAAETEGAATLGKAAAEGEGAAALGEAAAEAEGAAALGKTATEATGAATLGKAAAGDGTKGGSPLERATTTWEAATEAAEGKQRGWGSARQNGSIREIWRGQSHQGGAHARGSEGTRDERGGRRVQSCRNRRGSEGRGHNCTSGSGKQRRRRISGKAGSLRSGSLREQSSVEGCRVASRGTGGQEKPAPEEAPEAKDEVELEDI